MKSTLFAISTAVACMGTPGIRAQHLKASGGVRMVTSGAVQLVTNAHIALEQGARLSSSHESNWVLTGKDQQLQFGTGAQLGSLTLAGNTDKLLMSDLEFSNVLAINGSSRLMLGNSTLSALPTAVSTFDTIINPGYVAINGSGGFRYYAYRNGKSVSQMLFPVGDGNSAPLGVRTPVSVTIDSGFVGENAAVTVKVFPGKAAGLAPTPNYLNRYWTVQTENMAVRATLAGSVVSYELMGSGVEAAYYDGSKWKYGDTIPSNGVPKFTAFPLAGNGIFTGGDNAQVLTGNGSWNDPANWFNNTVPSDTDNVYIPAGKTATITSGADSKVKDLKLEPGSGLQINPQVKFTVNGKLEANGNIIVRGEMILKNN